MNPNLHDPLLRELIPQRISRPDGCHMGPTAQWALHERDLWELVNEVTPDGDDETPHIFPVAS